MATQSDIGPRALTRSVATVLVVDDEPANLSVLNGLLRPHFDVQVARSGAQALVAVATQPPPDLILLDVMMPEMDGYAVLARLRSSPASRDIPVIFVTAADSQAGEQRGLELGAVDYITKPITPAIVLARVITQLQAKQARDMLRRTNQQLEHRVAQGVDALEQAQLQLLHSEKMASIGQLAAGVAHEINNPIGFVGSNLNTLGEYLDDILAIVAAYDAAAAALQNQAAFEPVRQKKRAVGFDEIAKDVVELLAESRDGVQRVHAIVQDLRSFSHVTDRVWESANVHQCLDSTLNIVWNELRYHCTVVKNYGNLPPIYCLPSQLNQVFMNLLVNAGQAIVGKGEISITTECDGADSVRIMIGDTGMGIAPDAMARVFDPFFTTKSVGKGTGLGLSLAWSIVERHSGKITLSSEVGRGTTFTVTLPINPAGATDPGANPQSPASK